LVAVDAEKLTMTGRRPPHKKSRQETQSTAAFFKPSTASSGATAASGEDTGGLGFEPLLASSTTRGIRTIPQRNFLGGDRGTQSSCFGLLEIVTV
jgi:hypothetical protein